jgi:hypothetical protein
MYTALTVDSITAASSITALINGTISASSGVQYLQSIAPTINQSGTAGYTALLINPTETATGSGAKTLIDAQVGGASKFKVDNTGTVTSAGDISVPDEAYGAAGSGAAGMACTSSLWACLYSSSMW